MCLAWSRRRIVASAAACQGNSCQHTKQCHAGFAYQCRPTRMTSVKHKCASARLYPFTEMIIKSKPGQRSLLITTPGREVNHVDVANRVCTGNPSIRPC